MNNYKLAVLIAVLVFVISSIYIYMNNPNKKSNTPTQTTSTSTEIGDADLLTVRSEGGLCSYGKCFAQITIRKNGTYVFVTGDTKGEPGEMKVAGDNFVKLNNLITSADFNSLRSEALSLQCPTAHDGTKYIYSFNTAKGKEIIDSCVSVIDVTTPFFKSLKEIITPLGMQIQ